MLKQPGFMILLLAISLSGYSQTFINLDREAVKKKLEIQKTKSATINILIEETDSTVSYRVQDPGWQPTDFIYSFDAGGKCNLEKVVASCDSCFVKYLNQALAWKKYRWKKWNANQYISNFKNRLLLELPADKKDHSFMILKTNWSRKQFKIMK